MYALKSYLIGFLILLTIFFTLYSSVYGGGTTLYLFMLTGVFVVVYLYPLSSLFFLLMGITLPFQGFDVFSPVVIMLFTIGVALLASLKKIYFPMDKLFVLFFVVYLISLFLSLIVWRSDSKTEIAIGNILYLYMFFWFSKISRSFETEFNRLIFNTISSIVMVIAVFALVHYFYGDSSRLSAKAYSSILDGKQFLDHNMGIRRFIWPGVDPNFFAFTLLVLLQGLLFFSRQKTTYIEWASISLCYFLILGTFSRTGFLLATLSLMVFVFISSNRVHKKLLVSISAIFVVLSSTNLVTRIFSIADNLRYQGGTGRLERFISGIDIMLRNPLGVGPKQFGVLSSYGTSHNTFIQAGAEFGIFYLLLYFICFLVVGFYLIKFASKKSNLRIALIAISAWFSVFIFMNTIPLSDQRIFVFFVFLTSTLIFKVSQASQSQNVNVENSKLIY